MFVLRSKPFASLRLPLSLRNIVETKSIEECDVIVVFGGDGFLLESLRTYVHHGKPFLPINIGTVGALSNSVHVDADNVVPVRVRPLDVTLRQSDGASHTQLAFNDVSLLRDSSQCAHVRVHVNDMTRLTVGDGVCISTSLGSTGYNMSLGGPIIPIGCELLSIRPISPYRPWNGILLSNTIPVRFETVHPEKRPVTVDVDNKRYDKVVSVDVRMAKEGVFATLLHESPGLVQRMMDFQMQRS